MAVNMGSFNSLGAFAEHLAGRAVGITIKMEGALHEIGKLLVTDMKGQIGEYQPQVGPYVAWAPLADSTLNGFGPWPGKIAKGQAPPDNPLRATGEMEQSISYDVSGLSMEAGFADKKMIWHEFGTSKMPPRPVVGPAAFRNTEAMRILAGAAVVSGLMSPAMAASAFSFAPGLNLKAR